MNSNPNPAKLREVIAETIWRCVSADDVPHTCDALGMPAGPEGANPWASKRRYVRNRLIGLTPARSATWPGRWPSSTTTPSSRRSSPPGVHGVDGELKNPIFAAHGPKPRIVLRDAINNVIEIVEHTDKCLVYNRPLDAAIGLSWCRAQVEGQGSRRLSGSGATVHRRPSAPVSQADP